MKGGQRKLDKSRSWAGGVTRAQGRVDVFCAQLLIESINNLTQTLNKIKIS
jgi:hypothetical protein